MSDTGVLKVLSNKEYLKLWSGQICTYFGDALIQIALIAWIMTFMDKVGSQMAMIVFFFMLPSFILSPLAGVLSDKFSRKSIMVLSNVYRAILVIGITYLASQKSFITNTDLIKYLSYSFACLLGIGSAFFYPPKQSIIPNLIKSSQLQAANAINAGTTTITILLGAIAAGFIIAKAGLVACLGSVAVLYIASGILVSFINEPKGKTSENSGIIKDFQVAFNYLNTHKKTFRLILVSISLSLITASFFHTLNAVAVDHYKIGIDGLSKLKGILGVGMIAGTFVTIYLSKLLKPAYLLAVGFMTLVLTTATAGLATTYTKAWFWLIAVGLANSAIVITLDTILQKATPDRFRGKVFGFRSMVTTFTFLATTWIVSQALNMTSPFEIFHAVAWASLALSLVILLFDPAFSYFILRSSINSIFNTIYPVRVEGKEHIPATGKVIFAGNHTGWFDTFIITSAIKRPVWFIAGPMVYRIPIVRRLVPYLNIISLKYGKGTKALNEAVKHLDQSHAVLIFPEGKLTEDGAIDKFRRGVGYIHTKSSAPIVPFAIRGGFEAWAWNKLPKFSKITIQFGQPLNMPESQDKEIAQELENRVAFMKEALDRRNKGDYDEENFLSIMQMKGDLYAPVKALSLKEKDGSWKEMSYIELSRMAKNFANYLIDLGIQRDERIAILSESRPEWGVAFFATIQAGSITVPLDIKLTMSELTSILSDCNPRVICVSNSYSDKALELKKAVPSLEYIFVLEETSEAPGWPSIYDLQGPEGDMARNRELDETALIVYTSGTTGNPKGVMTTFRNIISQLRDVEELFNMNSSDSLLSILPLNHLLELNMGFLGMMYKGAKISYSKSLSPREISKLMKERQVTYMITVPLFVKMLKGSIEKEIKKSKAQKSFDMAYNIAKYIPSVTIKKLLFGKIHAGFGGKMKGFICGGAPLDLDVAEFFEGIGIPVYQGYGLTETSPTLTTNFPNNNCLGSVGKALPSVELKFADTGEILAKGPNIMKGYYGKPEMTAEVIDEGGWFHTGDIGELDKDGYLYITGRIKNMIVLGGGKKIFPEEVEAVLEKSPKIKELCVMALEIKSGNKAGTEEVGVIITPGDDLQAQSDEELQKFFEAEVKSLGKDLASYKQPTVVVIHREELPKTATRKVKRKVVKKWYDSKDKVGV